MYIYADVLLELHWAVRDNREDRRRRLCGWSRHDETPASRVIELLADGRDYAVVEEPADDGTREGLELLLLILTEASHQLTRKQILKKWPERRPPNEATLWRWLQLAVQQGQLEQIGAGRKRDPYRYQFPGLTLDYRPDYFEMLDV